MTARAHEAPADPGSPDCLPHTTGTWLRPLHDWLAGLAEGLAEEPALVRVVLAAVQGSVPRECGVSMLVGPHGIRGTIGGGRLEWEAVRDARALLRPDAPQAVVQRRVLATELGQCCGGVVELWLERYTRADLGWLLGARVHARRAAARLVSRIAGQCVRREVGFLADTPGARAAVQLVHAAEGPRLIEPLSVRLPALWLFGAGHVGQALVRILAELPLEVTWVDARAELLPRPSSGTVHLLPAADPVAAVACAPAGARFLILTHSHALDYELCRAVLGREDFAWAGLIGSASKAGRFRSRLAREGLPPRLIGRLTSPIGIDGIHSKWPAAIAVAVAAQLLRGLEPPAAAAAPAAAGCTERCDGCKP
ncbi:MAG TPA: xanthine dehydrogenase accessory protein XdhC [Steroidobacteraceae bacterium]|nr:xanthine dehydrogenase accessory protein XdhC [Steroidobacteraceae bacterium]